MPPKTKRCPFCSETILDTAIKCKHCGSTISDTPASGIDPETYIRNALAARFELLEEIGRGGMSVVYKAIQKNLNRTVALKVLPRQFIHDEEFISRFHREAQAAASLSHPNLVTIFDEGAENGLHYISMEFVEGESLDNILQRSGPLSVMDVQDWIIPLAQGLGYAHEQGVIHRDIKSSNILVDNNGRTVLTDFGIARLSQSTQLTLNGMVLGTPEYMSPEQALGEEIDNRSDIYSLGVVIYQCLTGQLPFQSDTVAGTIYKIVNEPPKPLHKIRSDIPDEMDPVVLRSLEKQANKRYPNCKELIDALRYHPPKENAATLAFEAPVAAAEVGQAVRLRRKKRSFRILATLLLVAGILSLHPSLQVLDRILTQFRNISRTDTARIKTLLTQAQDYFDKNRLTTPVGKNAYETVQKVLAIDPGNNEARSMIEKIEAYYLKWGENQLENGRYEKAVYYYSKAMIVSNDKPQVRKQLESARWKLEQQKLEKFAGTWTKQMPGVTIKDSIEIIATPKLTVKMLGGWKVSDEKLDKEVLSFKARRGIFGQEFIYTVEHISKDHLRLTILGAQDQSVFEGKLTR
ncbi:serine/threonine protein kinase [bacterium]|nr:serine/threonine protein kinase [bacterium]